MTRESSFLKGMGAFTYPFGVFPEQMKVSGARKSKSEMSVPSVLR